MEYAIAVFRSRTETINFSNLLRSYGVGVSVINTPRKANVSCGISAKFEMSALAKAREILSRRSFMSFGGFFKISQNGMFGEIGVIPL